VEDVHARLKRARDAREAKLKAKINRELRGAVGRRVERVRARQRVAETAVLLPDALLLHVVGSDASMIRACRAVCHAWHWPLRVHACIMFQLMLRAGHGLGHVLACGAVCRSVLACTEEVRTSIARRHRVAINRARADACAQQWMHVRVRVAWEADGPGLMYEGVVHSVRRNGDAVRVVFDEGVGSGRLRAHTISVGELVRVV
jgi:hypothetical protein